MDPTFFRGVTALTFDCYGTLIDWEQGILGALRAMTDMDDWPADLLLEEYARHEAEAEAGPYRTYREILGESLAAVGRNHGAQPEAADVARMGGSVADWPAFPDSAAALLRLRQRFGLGVITNCDDDLFAHSNAKLGEPFKWVITAQQVGSYKPSERNFQVAFERLGRPRDEIIHVAQSLFHDHVPAKTLGMRTVWINRRYDRPGTGATPPARAMADLIFPDMATFAEAALQG